MKKYVLVTYPSGLESVTEIKETEDYTWIRGHGEMQQLIEQHGCTVVPLVPAIPDSVQDDIWSLVSCVSIVYHRKNTDYADHEHMLKAENVEKWLKSLKKEQTQ